MSFFLEISVPANCASWQFLELIPIVNNFITASPAFLEVVENGLPRMEIAGLVAVLVLVVVFEAAMAFAAFVAFDLHFNY